MSLVHRKDGLISHLMTICCLFSFSWVLFHSVYETKTQSENR